MMLKTVNIREFNKVKKFMIFIDIIRAQSDKKKTQMTWHLGESFLIGRIKKRTIILFKKLKPVLLYSTFCIYIPSLTFEIIVDFWPNILAQKFYAIIDFKLQILLIIQSLLDLCAASPDVRAAGFGYDIISDVTCSQESLLPIELRESVRPNLLLLLYSL